MTCSICGKEIEGFGNNAWPINEGICCDECNSKQVVPLRIFLSGVLKDAVAVVKANNTVEFNEHKEGLKLKDAQHYVEGYIGLLNVKHKHFYLIVNEEGRLKNLPYNELAYKLFGLDVVGNLIVCPKGLFE